ncbi:hypothetical protein [Ferrimonas marina]|nr:hypothetical protein [Ferrimonas marina]
MIWVIAWCLMLLGGVLVFTPLPVGALLITLSLAMMLGVSPRLQNRLQIWRTNHGPLDNLMHKLERLCEPRWQGMHQNLVKTRPRR